MDPLSIIASVLTVIGAINSTYGTIKRISNLPTTFDKVHNDLILVSKILNNATARLEGIQLDAEEYKSLTLIASHCEKKINEMKVIFERLEKTCQDSPDCQSWTKVRIWYHQALKGVKGHRIESLMAELLKSVKLLVMNHITCLATTKDIDDIKTAITGLLDVEPSLDDNELENVGTIAATQSISDTASGNQWNMQGVYSNGSVSFGGTINHGGVHNSGGTHTHVNVSYPTVCSWDIKTESVQQPSNKDVFSWLTSLSFSSTYEACLNDWQEGTGQWFLETPLFKMWRYGGAKTLWCQGHAGVGKTMIMSIAIYHLKHIKSAHEAVIYVYLDHNDVKDSKSTTLIASLVRQLAEQAPELSAPLLDSYKRHTEADTPLLKRECKDLFLSEADRFKRVYIVIDGLDERRDEAVFGLLSTVNRLLSSHPAAFLLVSSRKIASLCSFLNDPAIFDLEAQSFDIDTYIEGSLASDLPVLNQHVRKYPGLSDLIKRKLNEKAQGMFLLPKLHLQILEKSKCRNKKAYEQLLCDLPSPLGQTYELLWNRIQDQDNEDSELATMIMTWLCCSRETLSIGAFGYALLSSSRKYQSQSCEDDLIDDEQLVDVCLGLVVINRGKTTIGFAHYTAEEHFRRSFPTAGGHQIIASACLHYMSNIPLEPVTRSMPSDLAKQLLAFPFFSYAARNWGLHVKSAGEVPMLCQMLQFFNLPDRVTASGRVLALSHDQSFLYDSSTALPDGILGFHLAAYFGLLSIIKERAKFNWSVDLSDTRGWSVLRWASFGRQTEFVRLLLEQGANADLKDTVGDTTLIWALGRRRTIHVFKGVHIRNSTIHFGYNTYIEGLDGINPTGLQVPQSFNSTPETIKDLIQSSQDLNSRGYLGRTALSHAAENQQFEVVGWLLDRGVDFECKDDYGMTPLLWSLQAPRWCYRFVDCTFSNSTIHIGDFVVVDLMESSTDGETLFRNRPPRNIAQETNAWKLIGGNFDAVDVFGLSALMLAAERGYYNLVERLIRIGADVNLMSGGYTVLDRAYIPFYRQSLEISRCAIMDESVLSTGTCMQVHWNQVKGLKQVEISRFPKSQSLICTMLSKAGAKTAVSGNEDLENPKNNLIIKLESVQDVISLVQRMGEHGYYSITDSTTLQRSTSHSGVRAHLFSNQINFEALPSFHTLRKALEEDSITTEKDLMATESACFGLSVYY